MKKIILSSFVISSCLYSANENTFTKLEDVVVTANKMKDKKSKVPLSISVINEKDYLSEGVSSLYDTLKNEVGVSVTGGEGRSQNITIRGISGNRIKVLKDGVSISDGYGANNLNDVMGSNTFDFTNMKEIEILKGANSSVAGSGGLGGLIVIKTKQLNDYLSNKDTYFEAISKYSGLSNKYQQNLVFAKKINNLELALRGNYSISDETSNYEKNVYKRDITSRNIALLQGYNFKNVYWSNTFEHYNEEAKRNDGIAPTQLDGVWEAKNFKEKKETYTNEIISKLEFSSNNDLAQNMDLKAYYRNTKNTQKRNVLMNKNDNSFIRKRLQKDKKIFHDYSYGTDFDVSNNLDNHTFKYGISLKYSVHDRPIEKKLIENTILKVENKRPFAKANTKQASLYIMDKLEKDRYEITGALRYDHQKLSGENTPLIKVKDKTTNNISPSISFTLKADEHLNLYSSYNFGFKSPTYDKVYGYVPHLLGSFNDFILMPNPDLKEETSDNLEIGMKYKDDKKYFHLALFYTWYKDFIEPKTVDFDTTNKYTIKKYINTKKVRIYGFETSYSHKFDDITLQGNLGIVEGVNDENERISTLTPLEGNIKLTWENERISTFSRVNFASSMSRVPVCVNKIGMKGKCAKSKAWMTLDGGLSYNFSKNYNLNLTVFNILDKRYIKYQDISGRESHLTDYDASASRYFNASLKMEF